MINFDDDVLCRDHTDQSVLVHHYFKRGTSVMNRDPKSKRFPQTLFVDNVRSTPRTMSSELGQQL